MITVHFYTTLRIFLQRTQLKIKAEEVTMIELLQRCQTKISKPFLHKLLDNHATLHPGTIILVNGQHVAHLQGLETLVKSDDDVALFPPGGGG